MDWRERIVLDPAIDHGDPCIKGSRVPVSIIVGRIADGDTFDNSSKPGHSSLLTISKQRSSLPPWL